MNYLGYILSSPDVKTRWLLHYARRDAFFLGIVRALVLFGYEIRHPFFVGNGVYQPFSLSVNSNHFQKEFMDAVQQGEMKAQFRLTPRHGSGAAAFHFLHELVHFQQDMNGLFLYPLRVEGQISIQPDLESQIRLHQFCEAMAAGESIRGAYRLKQIGYPQAWRGAMGSVNWRGLAKVYAKHLKGGVPEMEAAQRLFEGWYKTSQPAFYEAQVRAAYKPVPPEFERRVDILPDKTLRGAEDIRIGTPPYLWKKFKA